MIREFGILNTLVDDDDHPWYGIPHPGTYVMDATGTVAAKFFESSLFLRPAADQLLRAALGEEIELPPADPSDDGAVSFDVHFDGDVLHAGVLHDLIVRFSVPDGQHLYGEPVPDGMVATTVEIDPVLSLVTQPPVFPPTSPHTLEGTGETLQVFDGDVVVRVPLTHLGRSLTELDDGSTVQRITGTARWQSCDDQACHLPRTEAFSIDVPATPHDHPQAEVTRPDGMDVVHHLTRMITRKSDKTLPDVMTEIAAD